MLKLIINSVFLMQKSRPRRLSMAGRLSLAMQFLRQKNSVDNVVERIRVVKLTIHRVSLTLKSRGE